MELLGCIHSIIAAIAVVSSAIATIDHILAFSKKAEANCVWQLFTKKKGAAPMAPFVEDIEKTVKQLEDLGSRGMKSLEVIDQFVQKAASTVENVATMSGNKQLAAAAEEVGDVAKAAEPVIEKLEGEGLQTGEGQ